MVEIDESKFYRSKYNRGRPPAARVNEWVFGLVERGTNIVVMLPVPDRTAATLLPLIQQWVRPQTRIVSDGWSAYGGINALQQQYDHNWVNHKVHFVSPGDPSVHTQGIDATWGAIKRDMKHLSGTTPNLFPTYLFQYMFRRFHNRQHLTQQMLHEIRIQYPFN